ncbi:hypothetical protein BH09ACT10_BH09ACT10_00680 [soil metagenome]
MSKREDRERRRVETMLPDEREVAAEIFAAMSMVGEPGSSITSDQAALASQVAGAEAAGVWLKAGHSLEDCGMIRRLYEYVGNQTGEDVAPGGRLHGATLPDGDGDGDGDGDDYDAAATATEGPRHPQRAGP